MKQLQIIGHIGYDAVIKESNGNKFVQFTVAVGESYKDKEGNKVETTDWISCISRQLTLCQYLTKGKKVFAQGKMTVNTYKGRDNAYKSGINLNCSSIEFLGGAKKEESTHSSQQQTSPQQEGSPGPGDDDLPF